MHYTYKIYLKVDKFLSFILLNYYKNITQLTPNLKHNRLNIKRN